MRTPEQSTTTFGPSRIPTTDTELQTAEARLAADGLTANDFHPEDFAVLMGGSIAAGRGF